MLICSVHVRNRTLTLVLVLCVVLLIYNSFLTPLMVKTFLSCLKPDVLEISSYVAPRERDTNAPKEDLRQRLPKALIIGFNKCGTTALRLFLSIHPDVVSPTSEVRFFVDHYSKGLEWYRKQMPMSTSTQITIEKTPAYIKTSQSLRRIKAFDPDIKLIVIVRNPVTRLQSEYAHEMQRRDVIPFRTWMYQARNDFNEQVVYWSNYSMYLRQAFNVFPKNRFLILSEEELEKDPTAVIQRAEKFLGLREIVTKDALVYNETKGFFCVNKSHEFFQSIVDNLQLDITTGCMLENKGRPHPSIEDDLLQKIIDASKKNVEDLFELIQKRFDWVYY